MSGNEIDQRYRDTFDSIRHTGGGSTEYWSARQLAKVLEYSEYRHFIPVIERAKIACDASGHEVSDHFEDILDMVQIGSGAKRQITDVHLSCYTSSRVGQ